MLEKDIKLPDLQMCFRKGRNTVSAAWMLKNICSKRLKERENTFLCFLDFPKAFSYVEGMVRFDMMARKEIPDSIISIIGHIYNKTHNFFKYASRFLKTVIQPRIGVPEACILSPTLFQLYLSDLGEHLQPSSIQIGDTK